MHPQAFASGGHRPPKLSNSCALRIVDGARPTKILALTTFAEAIGEKDQSQCKRHWNQLSNCLEAFVKTTPRGNRDMRLPKPDLTSLMN
jgi:hypothetical protein